MRIESRNQFPDNNGFSTPQATWRTSRRPVALLPLSERKHRSPSSSCRTDLFHVMHKVPSGDSPYVRAKHAQLIDKEPGKAVSLFWAAINSGDRVDSALKDMAVVMKQLDRAEEAIEAIKSFRHLCPNESQESLDNLLVELYKRSGRVEDEIEMLQRKLKCIEDNIASGRNRTKTARSRGKKIHITVDQERSRVLGNLAWAYLQKYNYGTAEELYRKAIALEPDNNKRCNLAICLMHMNRISEAKSLLHTIRPPSFQDGNLDDSFAKSFERAFQLLSELDSSEKGVNLYSLSNVRAAIPDTPLTQPQTRSELDSSEKGVNLYSQRKGYFSPSNVRAAIPDTPLTQPQTRTNSWFCGKGNVQKPVYEVEHAQRQTKHMESQRVVASSTEKMETFAGKDGITKCLGNTIFGLPEMVSESHCKKMSWADMAEEEEQELLSRQGYYDENLNSNIIRTADQMEHVNKNFESFDLNDECSKSGHASTVRRSLCFDQQQNFDPVEYCCAMPVHKIDSFATPADKTREFSTGKYITPMRRKRLPVFENITQ